MCFPTFLLLLILMSMLKDKGVGQSILLVIMVLGLTGWIGLCRLVRGEVLKQRVLPYIISLRGNGGSSCEDHVPSSTAECFRTDSNKFHFWGCRGDYR